MKNSTLWQAGLATVILHGIVVIVHSVAHTRLQILMVTWQNVYILLVIILMPLFAMALLWRRRRAGFYVLLCSMLGSLAFGGYYHFIAAGADNVNSLGVHEWTAPFQISAVLLAVTEALGAIIGCAGLVRRQY